MAAYQSGLSAAAAINAHALAAGPLASWLHHAQDAAHHRTNAQTHAANAQAAADRAQHFARTQYAH